MDYNQIISQSFRLAWKYKSLWIFGLFAGGITSLDSDVFNWHEDRSDFGRQLFEGGWGSWFQQNQEWLQALSVPLILMIAFIMLALFIMFIISHTALIDAVNRITRGGTYRFGTAFSVGLDFFWRMLGLTFIQIVIGIFVGAVYVGLIVMFFFMHVAIGVLALLVTLPIGIFAFIAYLNIFDLSARAMVVRNVSIADSLHEGYALFIKHKGPNIAIFFIRLALMIFLSICSLIVTMIIFLPILSGLYFGAGLLVTIIIGLPLVLGVLTIVSGFLDTAMSAMYTIFYFRLVEPGVASEMQPTV